MICRAAGGQEDSDRPEPKEGDFMYKKMQVRVEEGAAGGSEEKEDGGGREKGKLDRIGGQGEQGGGRNSREQERTGGRRPEEGGWESASDWPLKVEGRLDGYMVELLNLRLEETVDEPLLTCGFEDST